MRCPFCRIGNSFRTSLAWQDQSSQDCAWCWSSVWRGSGSASAAEWPEGSECWILSLNVGLLPPCASPRSRWKQTEKLRGLTSFCECFLKPLQYLSKAIRIIAKFTGCLLPVRHFPTCFIRINSFNSHDHPMREALFFLISLMRKLRNESEAVTEAQ